MFLLVCTLDKGVSKKKVEEVVIADDSVKRLTWFHGQNGKSKKLKDTPMISGGFDSFFKYEDQDVLFAKIFGRDNVDFIISHINTFNETQGKIDYFVVPIIA